MSTLYLPRGGKAYQSIVRSTGRINLWDGAVRSGKSWASVLRWLDFIASVPKGMNLMMVGKTERTLYRNIITVMQELCGPENIFFNQGRSELKVFGRTIFTSSANDESSQDKIRGITLAGAYGDEISLWPESYFKMLLSRLSVRGAKAFFTTNPDSPYHYLKREYIDKINDLNNEETPDLFRYFHFTLDDNPTLDPVYVASLKKEYTGIFYKRFIDGEWALAEGAVYDVWDTDVHVQDINKNFRYYVVGCDYGTNNPTAFVMVGFDHFKGPFYVVKEFYYDSRRDGNRQKSDAEYADELAKFVTGYRVSAIYLDPSAASFAAELRRKGLFTSPADNSVMDGIRFVGSCLAGKRLYVDKSCRNIIMEFSSYVWDDKAALKGEDKPMKDHDHALDALRYVLYTHFERTPRGVIGGFNLK